MSALIFVADDDDRCRRLVREVVEYGGHEAELFANGQELLDRLDDRRPHLLILDIQMPGMTGVDVLAAIRRVPDLNFPVIAITASVMPSERQLLSEAGFMLCLTKPLSLKNLATVIEDSLSSRKEYP